ncbi:FxsA family protein [Oceanidesulfovibrio marinus]|uniref:FxsA family protein n=1 Tax=Oceanidesulfovibrio marinus TaxID=370038 RepID=A0A6P1ZGG8_9BACT|nr:FxsA family protein [Oceanidesulfovibrio marinus]QJT08607.1 FxsA family protein [Oceanidesulfovibrio marinus]TVM32557.1 membrane protein FxsA [Oceanidesulfovibrio marinus]
MLLKLFLGFTLIPLLELYLLITVGSYIGAAATILIVILTGAVGAWLARMQGVSTMLTIRERLNSGQMPAEEMIDAALILVAGLLLLTPGLITDVCGLTLLIPPARNAFKRLLRRKFDTWIRQGHIEIHRF